MTTIKALIEKPVFHYLEAGHIISTYRTNNIFRYSQHAISYITEDLLAYFLQQQFENIYEYPIYFIVDYPMNPREWKRMMFPDIAVIFEESASVLASNRYLKTDLGYKRYYFNQYNGTVEKITNLRNVKFTGTTTMLVVPLKVSPILKWRKVVVSKKNSDGQFFDQLIANAAGIQDKFQIYFFSDKQHSNDKIIDSINISSDALRKLSQDITFYKEQAISGSTLTEVK